MQKTVKFIRNILILIFIVIIIALIVIFASHKVISANEYKDLENAGYVNLVSVGDYRLNTCIYGNLNSDQTIVGISGMGVSDFAVTVKPFMEKFADEYRIAIVDRAGYGLSDDTLKAT